MLNILFGRCSISYIAVAVNSSIRKISKISPSGAGEAVGRSPIVDLWANGSSGGLDRLKPLLVRLTNEFHLLKMRFNAAATSGG